MHFRLASYESHYLNGVIRCYAEAVHQIGDEFYSRHERLAWAPVEADGSAWAASLRENKAFLALGAGNEVLGFADIVLPQKKINRLYVHPDAQGKGVGTQLLATVEQEILLLEPCSILQLESSLNARGFYEKQGYTCIGSREVIFNGVTYCNWLMEKQISTR
jgi:putative acetyltransferase